MIYTQEELVFGLQNLKKSGGNYNVRMLLALINLTMLVLAWYYRGIFILAFFTNWALIGTIFYMFASALATQEQASVSTLAIHHMLYTFTLPANIVVTAVYWPLLHKYYVARPEIAEN